MNQESNDKWELADAYIESARRLDEQTRRMTADMADTIDALIQAASALKASATIQELEAKGSLSIASSTSASSSIAMPSPIAIPKVTESAFRWMPGEETRIALLPLRHEDIWEFRRTLEALHWNAEEVDLSKDKKDWDNRMTADERHFVRMQLAFFAGADIWVVDNLDENFVDEIDCLEARAVWGAQINQEWTHTDSYNRQIEAVMTGAERDETLNAAQHMPVIAKMRAWARRWFDRKIPIGERLIAWAMFEGVLFSASFASLQWLRDRNLLPGITDYNTLIARDEGVHTLHACLYVKKYLVTRPAITRMAEIVESAIATLDEFVTESLPVRLIGMNSMLMREYVRFQADSVVNSMGYKSIYGVKNPFPTMDKLTLNEISKVNFFERKSLQYQNPAKMGATSFAIDTTPVED